MKMRISAGARVRFATGRTLMETVMRRVRRARFVVTMWMAGHVTRPVIGRLIVLLGAVLGVASMAGATSYYVDATAGNDANSGLSAGAAWKTIAKVNAATFVAGDQILFKRGEVWWESLVPPSSGTSGSPIVFDAYGTGEAPTITGALDLPAASWSVDSGNIWKASVTAPSMSYVLFGTVWGTKQTSKSAVLHDRDFYLASNVLYVYAPGINPATYYGNVAAMLMANGQLVYL